VHLAIDAQHASVRRQPAAFHTRPFPSRSTNPATTVTPRALPATSRHAARFSSTKEARNSRSSGGYPGRTISGKTTRFAPDSRARPQRKGPCGRSPRCPYGGVDLREGEVERFPHTAILFESGRRGKPRISCGKIASPMASPSGPLYGRDYILLNVVNFLYSLYSVIYIFLPAYMYRLGIREGAIGVLMATGTLVSVVLKPGLGMVGGRGRGGPSCRWAHSWPPHRRCRGSS